MVSEKSRTVMSSKYMRLDHLAEANPPVNVHGVRRLRYTMTVISEEGAKR